jgi:predicted small integral membrane protein
MPSFQQSIAWMAWTWQTGLFFGVIVLALAILTWLALRQPETERVGALGIATTRGDRFFLTLLGAAFIHLAFLGLFGAETILSLPVGAEGLEVSRLWIGTLIALVYGAIVFRFV